MKILVPIKRVIDPYVKIRVKADNTGVETNNVKMSINPFDEIAVEEALRLRESGKAKEVVVVSIGDTPCQETLRQALALGADRAIFCQHEGRIEPLHVAKILQKVVEKENPNLVIMGKQAIDGDHNQCGQMLAALLNWPQACFASNVELDENTITVTREIDGGLDTLACQLPAVITTDLRLNEPRYASLPNIMKAKKKPMDTIISTDLGLDFKDHTEILQVEEPAKRDAGIIVSDVAELVAKLKTQEKVI